MTAHDSQSLGLPIYHNCPRLHIRPGAIDLNENISQKCCRPDFFRTRLFAPLILLIASAVASPVFAATTKTAAQVGSTVPDQNSAAGIVKNIKSFFDLDAQTTLVTKPVWELGVGAAYFSGHDYPASNDPNETGLALPFFLYRSERLRVQGRGIGAVAIERPRFKLDVSVGGSLNAESSGNAAREGLPDLDFLFELGPRLNVALSRKLHSNGAVSTWRWLNSLQGVVSTDFAGINGRGYLFKSELEWKHANAFGSAMDLQVQLDAQWATRNLHDYFYSVGTEFATPSRAAFRARSGYLGTTVSIGLRYRITPALRFFTAVQFENFSGAANSDSPLFETENTINFATALVWTLRSSERSITVFDDD